MTRAVALREGAAALSGAGHGASAATATPALDASLLLAFVLGLSREGLHASTKADLSPAELARFLEALSARSLGRPVALITGTREFWGRAFAVDGRVLVPRPETELLVELALRLGDLLAPSRGGGVSVHECCAGSGAVAVSVAAERPSWRVSASDISSDALAVAGSNADRHLGSGRPGGPLVLARGDLLSAAGDGLDLVLANPPYVEAALARELAEAWGEPLLALDGGADGLDLVRRLVPEAAGRLAPGGSLLVEADPEQAGDIRGLLSLAGFGGIETWKDLAGHERVTRGVAP